MLEEGKRMRSKEFIKKFVDYLFSLKGKDKGLVAYFKRADKEVSEWKIWQVLYRFGVDLQYDDERRAFALIGACIAKSKQNTNGSVGLGRAFHIATDKEDGNFSPRFMRVLSAENINELIVVLRPSLAYLTAKCGNLDFGGILYDILAFKNNRDDVRKRWAENYLGDVEEDENE